MTMMESTYQRHAVPLNMEPANGPQMREREAAKVDGDGLSLGQLEKFLTDIRDEPEWRSMANRCADYYDHNQLSDEVRAEFRRLNLPPLVINLIHPTINTVLGMEAKTRTDWQVTFEDERFEEVALALGQKVTEAERMSAADRAISNAYAGQIKAGLHWVEVNWNSNPFGYRYRVRDVHRRECWWDWRTRDIEDWRYFVRRQRFDADRLRKSFPQFREMIDAAVEGGTTWQEYAHFIDDTTRLGQFIDIERALTFDDQEWIDTTRKQLSVFEVWYRVYVRGYVARLGETVIEVDRENPRHMLAIAQGAMKPTLATFPRLRQAIFIGPQRVIDRPSPMPHRKIPYVPFFGYREDLTGAPYGLIRGMLSSQDEINSRRSKMRAMLNARRVEADEDALSLKHNTHDDAADEASRHDSYIILNPNRKNGQHGFRVSDNADLSVGQGQVLTESKQEIHQTSGVFPPMAGDNKGGLSGLAINSLVEQGTQTLAEINDNYSWARREVGDQVLELVKHDSTGEETVSVGESKKSRKLIILNGWDNNTGVPVSKNHVASAQVKLVLDDVPSTPAWRQQQSAHLAEITKAMPPDMQAFIVPFYIESTDLRDRKKIASLLRKQMGLPEPGMEDEEQQSLPPEVQAQLEQSEVAVQELSAKLEQMGQENAALKLAKHGKDAEVAVKAKAADEKAALDRDRLDLDRARAAHEAQLKAAATAATAPTAATPDQGSIVQEVTEALEPAIEEMTATMRELAKDFDQRLGAMEKRATEKPAASAAPAALPSLSLGPFNVQEAAPPAKPVRKTIRMKTPMGEVTATIEPEGGDGEPTKPAKKKD